MVALVYLDLTEEAQFTYHKPILQWVKTQFPAAVVFDLDLVSEPMLHSHAQRLLQEASFCLLCLKTGQKLKLGPELKLLDVLFRKGSGGAVAVVGEHPALEKVLNGRPAVAFAQASREEALQPFLASFLENSLKTENLD